MFNGFRVFTSTTRRPSNWRLLHNSFLRKGVSNLQQLASHGAPLDQMAARFQAFDVAPSCVGGNP
jgi:hypothetical protein